MTFQCHAHALHVQRNFVLAGSMASGAALTVNAKLQARGARMYDRSSRRIDSIRFYGGLNVSSTFIKELS